MPIIPTAVITLVSGASYRIPVTELIDDNFMSSGVHFSNWSVEELAKENEALPASEAIWFAEAVTISLVGDVIKLSRITKEGIIFLHLNPAQVVSITQFQASTY